MFKKMKRSFVKGCRAPHKVILLLSVQYLVETGQMTDNKVYLDSSLINAFQLLWKKYIDDGAPSKGVKVGEELLLAPRRVYPFSCSIHNPFYFMSNEPFWNLVKSDEWKASKNYSLKLLRECYRYAEIDQELFELMQDRLASEQMKRCLMEMLTM